MTGTEIDVKLQRLGEFLDRHRIDAALIARRDSFAWLTAGRDNGASSETSHLPAAILATRSERICLASTVDSTRMEAEELAGTGVRVVSYPWWDRPAAQKIVRELIGARRIACDVDLLGLGLPSLPTTFAELRWMLTDGDMARYREGGRRMTNAVQTACHDARPGQSEHEVAATVMHHVRRAGLLPLNCLVAGDERMERCRHSPPTDHKAQRMVSIITSAEYRGLICAMARVVAFGRPAEEMRKRQQAACNVDATMILSSKPGRRMSELFGAMEKAYLENGFAGQWKLLEQGGSAGYGSCEVAVTPDSPAAIRENQAFAWHPSVGGIPSQDTILVSARGAEMLTQISGDWPKLIGFCQNQTLPRPDMLVL